MNDAVSDYPLRIGVFGAYGFGNMGDAMLADATIAGIKRYLPNASFVAICQQPQNASKRHCIEAIPIYQDYIREVATNPKAPAPSAMPTPSSTQRIISVIKRKAFFMYRFAKFGQWLINRGLHIAKETAFTFTVFNQLRRFDMLVMSGSGQMNEEWGGPWRLPFALFRWTALARLAGCKVAYMSVGAGVFKSSLTRRFCKWAISLAQYRSVRDKNTFQSLTAWGVKSLKLVPDMAFSVNIKPSPADPKGKATSVCINPISYCDPRSWCTADQVRYDEYTTKLAEFGSHLLSKGFALHFVPNNLDMDNPTIDDIIAKLDVNEETEKLINRPKCGTYTDVYNSIGNTDFVIASRFHGVVFSLMQCKPVIAISHHYKYFEVLNDTEQGHYCMDIKTFEVSELETLFSGLVENASDIQQVVSRHVNQYRSDTEQQFKTVAKLAAGIS